MSDKTKEYLKAEFEAQKTKLRKEVEEENRLTSEKTLNSIYQVAQLTATKDFFLNRDFYLVLVKTNDMTSKEPLDNVFVRRSCPTPGYNQNVFKYHHLTGTLEFLWTIPRQHIYWHMYKNRSYYILDPKYKRQTAFIVSMESGKLLDWVKKENGELPDAVITINKKSELIHA